MFQENERSLTITEETVFVLRPILQASKLGCFNKYFPSANKNKLLQLIEGGNLPNIIQTSYIWGF
jgi:hypothetical protein